MEAADERRPSQQKIFHLFYGVTADDPIYPGMRAAQEGKYEKALSVFKKAVKVDPRRGAIAILLVRTYRVLAYSGSEEQWVKYLLKNRDEVEPSYYFEALLWDCQDREAVNGIERALRAGESSAHLHFLQACLAHSRESGAETVDALRKCVRMLPQIGVDPTAPVLAHFLSSVNAEFEDLSALLNTVTSLENGSDPEDAFSIRATFNAWSMIAAAESGAPYGLLEALKAEFFNLEDLWDPGDEEEEPIDEEVDRFHRFLDTVLARDQARPILRAYSRRDLARYTHGMIEVMLLLAYGSSTSWMTNPEVRELSKNALLPLGLTLEIPYTLFRPIAALYGIETMEEKGLLPARREVTEAVWNVVHLAVAVFHWIWTLDYRNKFMSQSR